MAADGDENPIREVHAHWSMGSQAVRANMQRARLRYVQDTHPGSVHHSILGQAELSRVHPTCAVLHDILGT